VRKPSSYLPGGRQLELDLATDWQRLVEAFDGADSVVHLAGHNEIVAAQEPERALTETVLASRRVAQAAADAGVRRIVYVSTVHVYGDRMVGDAVLSEDTAPSPRSTYAIARLASEHLIGQAADAGVEVVVLRLTNAIGAPVDVAVDRWTLVATDLCRQAVRDGELVLRSSGLQWRDFIALRDVCAAVARCIDPAGGIAPSIYNLGSGSSHTVRSLAELVQQRFAERTGTTPPLRTGPAEADPPRPYTVSVERLATAGWRAQTALVDAVDELVGFCLENEGRLR
jgi:UDP-glucose 4-epimerase